MPKPANRNLQVMRVFRVLQMLETSKNGMSAQEIHNRLSGEGFEMDLRTVRRDLDALIVSGFPLNSVGEDEQGGERFSLAENASVAKLIALSAGELLALYTAKAMFESLKGTHLYDGFKSLFAKFEHFLDEKKTKYLADLSTDFYINPGPRVGLGLNRDVFDTVHQACAEKQWLKVVYASANSGTTKERILGPHALYMNKGAMYLYAEERDAAQKGELKTFSLVRMQSAEMLDEAFDAPPLDINQHLAGSLGLFAGGDIRDVRIEFNHQVASFIRERQWHPSQNILTREDGSAEFTAQLAVSREIVQWILGFGSAARVLGPSELIQAVALEAAQITKIYQNQQGV